MLGCAAVLRHDSMFSLYCRCFVVLCSLVETLKWQMDDEFSLDFDPAYFDDPDIWMSPEEVAEAIRMEAEAEATVSGDDENE